MEAPHIVRRHFPKRDTVLNSSVTFITLQISAPRRLLNLAYHQRLEI
jgi:hypothetical protein